MIMQHSIKESMKKLSSKRVAERKKAIKELVRYIHHPEAYLARLSLFYVSIHDPCFTVRNVARQAFYRIGGPPSENMAWEKAYLFRLE